MKCVNCGFEIEENFEYCPSCGKPSQAESVSLNPAADKILCVLKDNLFLVICILMSAASGLSVIIGDLPLINILVTIFLWLTYAQSRKGIADDKYLRNVSGTVYANYVIMYVLFGLVFFIGLLFAFVVDVVANESELSDILASQLGTIEESYIGIMEMILSMSGWVLMLLFGLVAVAGILINALGMRKIHRFIKSVHQSISFNNLNLENADGAKNWLFVFGIFTAISALYSLSSGLTASAIISACTAAAQIIAGILIKKYLLSAE